MRRYKTRRKTVDELEQELEAIDEQEAIFDLEQEVKRKQIALRDKVLQQLEDDVTLDDIFEEMAKKSLCKKIDVWVPMDR